jgi:hypothetical protein
MENKKGITAGLVGLGLLIIIAGAWSNTRDDWQSNSNQTADQVTPTPIPSPTPAPISSGARTYVSEKLGLSFNYLWDQSGDGKQDTTVTEAGNKVYIHQLNEAKERGQWVERIFKDKNLTLQQAIEQNYLKNISREDCFFKSMNDTDTPSHLDTGIIAYPFDPNADSPWIQTKCPQQYSMTNGIRYFYYDKNYTDRFYFFDIGQYSILANEDTPWQNTFKITK